MLIMNTTNNIMLDIETVANTNNAAVIQVAMVRFDWHTGEIDDHLVVKLNLDEQLKKGLDVNSSTLAWWSETNPQLFKSLLTENVEPVSQALSKICQFIYFDDYIWCHATFDIPILNNLLHKFGFKTPWAYKKCRDIRTLTELAELDLTQYNWDKEKTHDALDDCKFQIKYCRDAYRKIKGFNNLDIHKERIEELNKIPLTDEELRKMYVL